VKESRVDDKLSRFDTIGLTSHDRQTDRRTDRRTLPIVTVSCVIDMRLRESVISHLLSKFTTELAIGVMPCLHAHGFLLASTIVSVNEN